MQCTQCQAPLAADANFCSNCGTRVARAGVSVDQTIGTASGAVAGVVAPESALQSDLSVSTRQNIERVTDVGTVVGTVFGGSGTTTIGGKHTHGETINAQGSQGFVNRPSGSVTQQYGSSTTVGNISGSTGVAIGTGASASVTTVGGGDAAARAELQQLIAELEAVLRSAPAAQAGEAEAVAETARQAVNQATRDRPNKTLVQISADGLKQAAQNLASTLPDVLPLATKIAAAIAKLIG